MAFVTGEMVNVAVCGPQMVAKPEMVPGIAGAVVSLMMFLVLTELLPHELFALTVIFPPLNELLNETVIEVVVEDPDAPEGKVQV